MSGLTAACSLFSPARAHASEKKNDNGNFTALFNNMKCCGVIYEPIDGGEDFIIKAFNFAAEKAEKIKSCEIIGKSILEVFPAVREFGIFEALQKVWRTGEPVNLPVSFYTDGRVCGWRENYIFRLETGEVAAIYEDLTEIRKKEELIQESDEKYKFIFENMLNGFAYHRAIYDENGNMTDYRYLEANKMFENITGIKSENLIGRTVREVIPGIEEYWIKEYAEVVKTGKPKIFENYVAALDKYFEVSVYSPVKDHFAVVCSDVTAQKKILLNLQNLNEQVVEKNRELEQMIYIASHDLRSPLINIQGFSRELIKSFAALKNLLAETCLADDLKKKVDCSINEDIPESIDYINRSAAKMDSLLTGILRVSRLGRAPLKFENVDMDGIISEIFNSFEFSAKKNGITIQKCQLPCCIGDVQQIIQVFTNLIDNAIKYRDSSRPCLIKVSGEIRDGEAVYCVEDNGVGIAPQHQKKIFELFHRLNPGTTSGDGLGLAIVQKILLRNNGKVWVESEAEKGSRFFVSLPAH